ncbi:MAG: autotransporter assembly complex family protein [Pseudomonadota bacterium]
MAILAGPQAMALDAFDFKVTGADKDLSKALRASSLLISQQADGVRDPQDLFAAARADYGRILAALYARGHYSGVIRILIDGREAAGIAPLDAPSAISVIEVLVDPGPVFAFAQARVAPLAPDTDLPAGFALGKPAQSGVVAEAVTAGIDGWRDLGHAKAAVSREDIAADHARATLSADIGLTPGPRLRFGRLTISGHERMRENRVRKIAGLKEGEVYSPLELQRAANRLRRTGIFASVALTEAEGITPPDLLGIDLTVVEAKTRRYSLGAEVASSDGVSLSGYWLHRNLLGGGERLKVDASVSNIGTNVSGVDYALGVTIDRPATLTPDTTATFRFKISHEDEIDYFANIGEIGLGFTQYVNETLTLRAGLGYTYAEGRDPGGAFNTRNLSLPIGVTWDRRDSTTNATKGFYLDAEVKPFLGFGTTGSGLRTTFDARAYRGFGADARVVLAGRVQGGAIFGTSLLETPRDDLFFSGGGGTVRGQPYKSLGVSVARGFGPQFQIGGLYQLGASVEARVRVSEKIGVVGFFDAGSIGVDGFTGDSANWHAGAGFGLRYDTGLGPIRLDIAAPVQGTTGDGVQIYIGLGQAF